jgi:uncharacterized protein
MRSTRRVMRYIIVLGALWLGSALEIAPVFSQNAESVGSAGSPEALRAATDLMTVMSPQMIGQLSQQMTGAVWPNLENSLKSKVDAATISDLHSEIERQIAKFTSEAMKDAPALYAKYFSAQELDELAAFYRSPTGAKALQVTPRLMGEFMTQMLPRMQGFQSEIAVSVQNIMKKHGYAN